MRINILLRIVAIVLLTLGGIQLVRNRQAFPKQQTVNAPRFATLEEGFDFVPFKPTPAEKMSLRIYNVHDITGPLADEMRKWPAAPRPMPGSSWGTSPPPPWYWPKNLEAQITDRLGEALCQSVAPELWQVPGQNTGEGRAIPIGDGLIGIWQSALAHLQIDRRLVDLRKADAMSWKDDDLKAAK